MAEARIARLLVCTVALLALTAHLFAMGPMRIRLPTAAVGVPMALEICYGAGADGGAGAASFAGGDRGGNAPGGISYPGECPLCSHHGASAPAPAMAGGRVARPARPLLPPLFLDAPDPLFAWSAQQSRGPPALS